MKPRKFLPAIFPGFLLVAWQEKPVRPFGHGLARMDQEK